ncbi:hypothetical protein JW756_03720 [Candidatus Woesearchaeota archaeon]|nr:hypothetical protein [Candidatus Woesearchaeota archaeon]
MAGRVSNKEHASYESVIKAIAKGNESDITKKIDSYKAGLQAKGIRLGQKESLTKGLDRILNAEFSDTEQAENMALGLLGMKKGYKNFSEVQRGYFVQLKDIIAAAPLKQCEHNDLEIIALWHGGGFFPLVAVPELYCKDCDLNVSLVTMIEADTRYGMGVKPFGIEMSPEMEKELSDWVNGPEFSKLAKVWVEEITQKPKEAYAHASKFPGDKKSLRIVDKEKVEQCSS